MQSFVLVVEQQHFKEDVPYIKCFALKLFFSEICCVAIRRELQQSCLLATTRGVWAKRTSLRQKCSIPNTLQRHNVTSSMPTAVTN